MSPCPYKNKIGAFYDGEIAGEEFEEVKKHIRQCPDCSAEMLHLKNISNMIQNAFVPECPSTVEIHLRKSLIALSDQSLFRMAEILAAAALVLFMIGSLLLWRTKPEAFPRGQFSSDWERAAVTLQTDSSPVDAPEIQIMESLFGDMKEQSHE